MRFALGIEYDGGGFSGWQRLSRPGEPDRRGEPTLQAALEAVYAAYAEEDADFGRGVESP